MRWMFSSMNRKTRCACLLIRSFAVQESVALCLLFSGGTFLYVATAHVLPEIQSGERVNTIRVAPHLRRCNGFLIVPRSFTLELASKEPDTINLLAPRSSSNSRQKSLIRACSFLTQVRSARALKTTTTSSTAGTATGTTRLPRCRGGRFTRSSQGCCCRCS